jgi:hypothetical protein
MGLLLLGLISIAVFYLSKPIWPTVPLAQASIGKNPRTTQRPVMLAGTGIWRVFPL